MKNVQKLFAATILSIGLQSCSNAVGTITQDADTIKIKNKWDLYMLNDIKAIEVYPIDSAKQSTVDTTQTVTVNFIPQNDKTIPGFGDIHVGVHSSRIKDKKTYDDMIKIFKKYNPTDTNVLDGIKIYASAFDVKFK